MSKAQAKEPKKSISTVRAPVSKPKTTLTLNQEIKLICQVHPSSFLEYPILFLNLKPSDPDFPFDLQVLKMEINFSINLNDVANDKLMKFKVLNLEIPFNLRGTIERSLKNFTSILEAVKWLDRNLSTLLVAPKSTIKFVAPPSPSIENSSQRHCIDIDQPKKSDNFSFELTREEQEQVRLLEEAISGISIAKSDKSSNSQIQGREENSYVDGSNKACEEPKSISMDFPVCKAKFGYQIIPQISMKQISLLAVQQISLNLKCKKCSTLNELVLKPETDRYEECTKCHTKIHAKFSPDTCFQQNLNFGIVESNCQPMDMLKSTFQIQCEECDDKSFLVPQIQIGEFVNISCFFCKKVLSFNVSSVKFNQVLPDIVKKSADQKLNLKINEPLPKKGTCKHYSKSFRWFRFPCCGKAYPCDICHDLVEKHESQMAKKMICGLCSKEQAVSSECSCGMDLDRKSTHWEGGKGTRNQITMSRKDSHKYKNITKS